MSNHIPYTKRTAGIALLMAALHFIPCDDEGHADAHVDIKIENEETDFKLYADDATCFFHAHLYSRPSVAAAAGILTAAFEAANIPVPFHAIQEFKELEGRKDGN